MFDKESCIVFNRELNKKSCRKHIFNAKFPFKYKANSMLDQQVNMKQISCLYKSYLVLAFEALL